MTQDMKRWIVTTEKSQDGTWEFSSYSVWVVDAIDAAGAVAEYIKAREDAAADIMTRYPGMSSDPWDGSGRPNEFGVAPIHTLGGFSTYSGPDRKHKAEAFDSLFDWDLIETVILPG